MYEHRAERVLPRKAFLWRLARHIGVGLAVVAASLFGGMLGYAHFERLGWLDAFLNAAMLMGGMGPVESPATPGGKLFAGFYALYCAAWCSSSSRASSWRPWYTDCFIDSTGMARGSEAWS